MNLVKLSDRVVYEINSDYASASQTKRDKYPTDRELLKAYIGFRTKKLAKAWLKPLKQIVGKLSNLKDCRREEERHLLEKKWQYFVETIRHKKNIETFARFRNNRSTGLRKTTLKLESKNNIWLTLLNWKLFFRTKSVCIILI